MVGAVGIGREVAPRSHKRRNRRTCCPAADVHFVRWIGRDPTAAHYQHQPIKAQSSCLPCGPGYGRYAADGVGDRVKAERVGRVHHQASLIIRCARQVDDASSGACRRVHHSFKRVHWALDPLGTYRSSRIKCPYLVGRGNVDVEPAQYVELVASHRKTTWQNCACRVARPVVCTAQRGHRVASRIIEEHARCGCGLSSCGAAHAVDIRSF